jgi:hypothetical protein
MFIEDYTPRLAYHKWDLEGIKELTFDGWLKNVIDRKGSRSLGYSSQSLCVAIQATQYFGFYARWSSQEPQVIAVSINKSIVGSPSFNAASFVADIVKAAPKKIGDTEIMWGVAKPLAIELGIYKFLKAESATDIETQKQYTHIKKEARTLVVQSLSKLNEHTLIDSIKQFGKMHIDVIITEDVTFLKFLKDLGRRMNKLGKNHSKESASKLLHFIENCPKEYVKYRK